jgi:DNA-binding SARP family transcriptional activator
VPLNDEVTCATIHLLGQYTITVADRPLAPFPTEKSRALFVYLLLHPQPAARGHLAGLFWPDLPEKSARRLTQERWRIRNQLEKAGVSDLVLATGSTVSLRTEIPIDCDVHQLQDALARLRETDPLS